MNPKSLRIAIYDAYAGEVPASRDAVTLTWQGVTALGRPRLYQLQRCAELGGRWEDLGDPTFATRATDPATGEAEFYRVIVMGN